MTVEPTIGLALLAGFVSFISPCVLPLIPAYIGYMSGQATRAAGQNQRFVTFMHGVFFVLGFTIFFVGFGLLTTAASKVLDTIGLDIENILTRLGGVAVILFGLYVMRLLDPVFRRGIKLAQQMQKNQGLAVLFSVVVGGVMLAYYNWVFENVVAALIALLLTLALFRKPLEQAQSIGDFWYRAISGLQMAMMSDTRNMEMMQNRHGYLGSLGMGTVFAAGWTPCMGPMYGSILTLAAASANDTGSLLSAGAMLTAYSLGLGLPFLGAALALNQMTTLMGSFKRNMRKVELFSGSLLLIIGVLVLSGNMERIAAEFGQGEMGELSIRLETCSTSITEGRLGMGDWVSCVRGNEPKIEDRVIFASFQPAPAPLFTSLSTSSTTLVEVGLDEGMRAPNFTTVTPNGEAVSLADFEGQVVLLNFWATWCIPCETEMPDFENIYQQYKDSGFTVVGVNFLEAPEAVTQYQADKDLSFPLVMDESGEINDLFGVRGYPTSYLIDGNGIIIRRQAGPLSAQDLVQELNDLSTGG